MLEFPLINDTSRKIIHIDMDAFFASVEQMDDPSLRGKPVIVGGEQRGVVSTCSYEARVFGVHSAMPMATARRLCPQAIVVRGRHARYSELSRAIMAALGEFSPLVEQASVDEAYVDFGGESCVPLIDRYDNLLVVQTFSKSRQLAGARLGLAMGNAKLIADLNRVKFSLNPYNINRLTLKAGQAALEDTAYFDRTRAAIVDTRAWTKQQLEQRGFAVLDSRSNFLFASTDRKDGGTLYKELKKNGILVRHFDAPRIQNWLRITIGTSEQMKIFVNTLDKIMEE